MPSSRQRGDAGGAGPAAPCGGVRGAERVALQQPPLPTPQCELYTAEKEAAAKIQAQQRAFTAKKQLRREVHNAAFNALDNHDENVRRRVRRWRRRSARTPPPRARTHRS